MTSQTRLMVPALKREQKALQDALQLFFQYQDILFEDCGCPGGGSSNKPKKLKVALFEGEGSHSEDNKAFFLYKRDVEDLAKHEEVVYELSNQLGFNHYLFFVNMPKGVRLTSGARLDAGFLVAFVEGSNAPGYTFESMKETQKSLVLLD